MQKVAYILPLYDEDTDTHLYYNYELIRYASVKLDIFVVIEKAIGKVNLNAPFFVQKKEKGLSRFLELYSMLKKLKKQGYDNFYVHYSYYGALAALLTGGKVFYWSRGMSWLFKRGFFEERALRYIMKRVTLVTGPETLAREYVKYYGVKKYLVLSNWVDTERFRPREDKTSTKRWFAIEPDTKIVLFAHHLSERKGADLIAKIAAGINYPKLVFFVIGNGPYSAKLEEEAKNLPLRIFGGVPNKDMAPYYQAADVFLMPSREEGSPHVILDALSAGTPFVASDVGGVREIVPAEFGEFLCKSEDVECFGRGIVKLLSEKDLYERLRQEGLEFVKKFDRNLGVAEFINVFQ
ncbi:hypothetical protein A3H04_02690 [Candidatus Giovannonibacteria bacterium RIFCSPLOWO2_12_FULL_43_11c]|uniref:Glycosyl transferase family 1 domain-containing protein n=1 Tax=Candidatus Giovannonibacteria bacterium RIFCSPHIGHO2_12_FULL_43_15 TaxID=1798341 RepID=A0A1F5WQR1_9BACT|nr:MAG: hypothetical protein A2739_02235 [Candidatus Giovannonibacteria bacterium RIFCSPHIGHO2_01_FULL_43_100]OGF67005.1 MAG: hypothetical protein A3B97_00190 [Candidatus Giovannonibacteria bacterium RIFCSPHIGHO2_02_FULL_43_32]OGF77927.1 MAG: hypothetical protein A3F23_04315 [Candidatus Giovannonibacteria bacterium RIFCSPHIGHO2_12_FULL_43_15]OGF78702.1 MAG: hypothetical protein A3A15_01990 [Candidatus Giovannonibacteria bacterium RIFCSPLOWO2_01_FULL_43_60]OGF91550.1 MAG: hypothetical protein A3